MWCVDLFNSVYVQWNLCYNCNRKFTKFDTKLNVQIPVEFRSKVFTGTGTGTGTKMLFRYRNRNSGRSMATDFTGRKWNQLLCISFSWLCCLEPRNQCGHLLISVFHSFCGKICMVWCHTFIAKLFFQWLVDGRKQCQYKQPLLLKTVRSLTPTKPPLDLAQSFRIEFVRVISPTICHTASGLKTWLCGVYCW